MVIYLEYKHITLKMKKMKHKVIGKSLNIMMIKSQKQKQSKLAQNLTSENFKLNKTIMVL